MENTKTILVIEIVEDDNSVQSALADKLSREGFSILEAKNGKEGLNIALTKHPDLILLDIKMPVIDGVTMLKFLRADQWGKNASVMVLSNLNDDKTISEALDQNTFEYFIKSDIKLEDLINKVKERLGIVPVRSQI